MPSEATNRATREEWRDLGFFYELDDEAKEWRLVGSREGLLRFRDLLLEYVARPGNAQKSEHEHYGPYMYLKVMTWPEAGFGENAIHGTLADLARLAQIVESKLLEATPGTEIYVREQFDKDSLYALVLDVREASFDPAAADPLLSDTSR